MTGRARSTRADFPADWPPEWREAQERRQERPTGGYGASAGQGSGGGADAGKGGFGDWTPPGGADLMRNWMTLWQSEGAAMAGDRELHETWQTLSRAWMKAMDPTQWTPPTSPHNTSRAAPGQDDNAAGHDVAARTHAASRPEAADAASGPGDAPAGDTAGPGRLDALLDRLDRIERRLDALDAGRSTRRRAPG